LRDDRRMTHDEFIERWNALEPAERRKLRRLVRIGRAVDDAHLAPLAAAYAAYQRSRVWTRLFWFWFVPGLVLALGIASRVHPLMVGVVIALAGQAVLAKVNLRRTALGPSAA
jgi:ferric-dicitrate binding protein FerR (iron transport regulator)